MLQQHALALGRMTVQERVCTLLVTLMDAKQSFAAKDVNYGGPHHIHMPMTRAEIGDYLGLSLETVCRTVTDLRRKNVIRIGHHHGDVTIVQTIRPRQLAGFCD
jgi:CRP-like cAMP-binding protein